MKIQGFFEKTGYSLVEVLIGTWLFATVVLMIISIFLNNYAVANYGTNLASGSNFALEKINWLKSQSYSTLESMVGDTQTEEIKPHDVKYTITSTVSRMSSDPSNPNYDLLILTVQVSWKDMTSAYLTDERAKMFGITHTISMESAVSPLSSY